MKHYKEVVAERYDSRYQQLNIYENMYSRINPIGFYGDLRVREAYYKMFNVIRKSNIDISKLKILDLGCGDGNWTRFYAELTEGPENIHGIDLSKYRVKKAKKMNPGIQYEVSDILLPVDSSIKYDLVTINVVLMHFDEKSDINKILENIYNILKDPGYLIWLDTYAHDHFAAPMNAESYGFHPSQMENLCSTNGFKRISTIKMYKNILWRFHSMYLYGKLPPKLIELMEIILPGSPGNIMILFQKE